MKLSIVTIFTGFLCDHLIIKERFINILIEEKLQRLAKFIKLRIKHPLLLTKNLYDQLVKSERMLSAGGILDVYLDATYVAGKTY